jgi:hypothetical protein
MSKTPETDHVRKSNDCNAAGFARMMLHARKLERERDEARNAMKQAMIAYAESCKAVDDWRARDE